MEQQETLVSEIRTAPKLYIDFETYYDRQFSLSVMPTQAYVSDPRFEIIGLGYMVEGANGECGEPAWVEAKDSVDVLRQYADSGYTFVAHNIAFDGYVLYKRYGIVAESYICTASLARYTRLNAITGSASLGASLAYLKEKGLIDYNKGTEVQMVMGKYRQDFTPEEWQRYGAYCKDDVRGSRDLCRFLMAEVTDRELEWQNLILSAIVAPVLDINTERLKDYIEELKDAQREKVAEVCQLMGISDEEELASVLRKGEKFAELLRSVGVEPEKKVSPSGKEVYAFAKTDSFMQELADSGDPIVQAVVAARTGEKGSNTLRRAQRIMTCPHKGFSAPYLISGAHTHRMSGSDKINMQNLDSGRVEGKEAVLRECILPPKGYNIWAGDSAQVEARVLSYLADDAEMLEVFRNNGDPYSFQASQLYGRPAADISAGNKAGDPTSVFQRSIGKSLVLGCFGKETLVLTRSMSGEVKNIPIHEVPRNSLVWDGVDWVAHKGVVYQGKKVLIEKHGVRATADHLVRKGRGWVRWDAFPGDNGDPITTIDHCYDILDAGSRHRFTIVVGESAQCEGNMLVVHNCGFGMGPEKFFVYAKQQGVKGVTLPDAREYIRKYRDSRYKVTQLWYACDMALKQVVVEHNKVDLGHGVSLAYSKNYLGTPCVLLRLPCGSKLVYPNLFLTSGGDLRWGRVADGEGQYHIYGAKLVENLVQAFAFSLMKSQALVIPYPIVMNVHDEFVGIAKVDVPKEQVEKEVLEAFTMVPAWAKGLPINASFGCGNNYKEC